MKKSVILRIVSFVPYDLNFKFGIFDIFGTFCIDILSFICTFILQFSFEKIDEYFIQSNYINLSNPTFVEFNNNKVKKLLYIMMFSKKKL